MAVAVLVALSGCAAVKPTEFEASKPVTEQSVTEQMSVQWNQPSSVKEGRQSTVLLTPMAVPREIKSKPVSLELEAGANVTDVVAALARLGHSVILADKEAGAKAFYMPRYEGNIGGLLSNIARVTDVWFTWHDGAIVVSAKERISVSFPQDSGLAAQLEKEVKAFGIDAASVSGNAGMLTLEVTPSQLRKVKQYLERATSNAAIVTLQLAIVNVSLNQDAKQGIDWEGLSMAVGPHAREAITDPKYRAAIDTAAGYFDKKASDFIDGSSSGGSSTGSGTSGGSTGSGSAAAGAVNDTIRAVEATSGLLMKAGGLNGLIATGNFSFGAMFNFLEKYGTAETRQNTVFKTVTGQEVSFKSLTEVPYVSELGAVASTNTTSSSVKTEKAKDGLELSMTPSFDAAANTVSVKLKMSLKAVLAFNELSAGNQVGKLTQPTTADRSFNDEIRLRPGQTAVVGGIVYDSISDKRALPMFMHKGSKLESQNLAVDRQVMFIVLRPAVTRLGDFGETEADTLDLVPNADMPLAPKPVAKQMKQSSRTSGKASKKRGEPTGEYRELNLEEAGE